MKNPRLVLSLAVGGFAAAGAAVGYFIVARSCPDTALARLWVDLGLLVCLVGVVLGLGGPRAQLARDLAEMLRGISIGNRDRRLDPARFGDLEDVARAANEVAAVLSEGEDPNIGSVRTLRRSGSKNVYDPERQLGDGENSYHPEIGAVRVIPRKDTPVRTPEVAVADVDSRLEARAPKSEAPAVKSEAPAPRSEPPKKPATAATASTTPASPASIAKAEPVADEHAASSEAAPIEATEAPPSTAPALSGEGEATSTVETSTGSVITMSAPTSSVPEMSPSALPEFSSPAVDEELLPAELAEADTEIPRSSETTIEAPTVVESAPPERAPPREGLRELFDQFITAKRAHDEPVDDLEFHSFATTLKSESEKLKAAHGCRGVRFEVKVQNGEVSLLPRLIR